MPRRRAILAAVLLGFGAATGSTLSYPQPASASPGVVDPAVGPHARDQGRHGQDQLAFTPAKTSVQPRRLRAPSAATAAPTAPLATTAAAPGNLQREVFGFAPYWALKGSGSWNYSLLSTVAYFGLDVKSDGNIDTTTPGWNGWVSQDLVDTINRAHAAGDRAVVVIKAFDEGTINHIVTDPTAKQTAITNVINNMIARNLDGVNVDFEGRADPSYPNIQAGFTDFMRQLSDQVHQRWPLAMVSVDTYSGSASWDGGLFNIGALAPYVDAFFVMAYDMAFGNMSGHAGPNAPLNGWTYNDTTSVYQYLSKAPASKVILGVPYYGYKWSTTSNQAYASTTGGAMADTYAGVLDDLSCGAQQLSKSWDATAASPWASWWSPAVADPCGGNHNSWRELYYDDARSLGYKYDLVNTAGLLGAGMWALGYDGSSPDLWKVLGTKFQTSWPGQFHPLAPVRILDTRSGIGGFTTPLRAGQSRDIRVTNRGGVPSSGVAAVVLNVTVTNTTADGHLTVYPTAGGLPNASNLNFGAGQTVANLVEVPVGKAGNVSVYNGGGSTDVIMDVSGWVSTAEITSGSAGAYQSMIPARLLDTRNGNGTGGVIAPLGTNRTLTLQVTGRGGVPATGASAVAVNLTVTNPTANSHLIAYPTGISQPMASNLNYGRGLTVANRAIVQLGSGGTITLYNLTGQTDVIVDVAGWFTDGSSASGSGGLFTGLTPARILDTRTGAGGIRGRVGPGSVTVAVAGQGGVPAMSDAVAPTAVVLNVTATDTTAWSHLTVYPSGAVLPTASDLNFTAGKTVPNLVIARLGPDGKIAIFNEAGQADLIVDVLGWYN